MQPQKQRILDHFARQYPAVRASFDESTGRFLAADGGWAQTKQDVILPLAVLWSEPGTDCHGRDDVLDLACRGGDCLRNRQDDAGRIEFVKLDGSRWGWSYMAWPMLHWLETYALLRDSLDAGRRERWEKGLTLAYDGISEGMSPGRVHNIPTWNAAGLVRGGRLFDRPEWTELGTQYIHTVIEAQDPDGYWPEGFGPTTGYNLVYAHAIGLYYHWSGDETVLPCLERAADFHMHFTYPDGTPCETVDGRVKYHANPFTKGGPGFLATPKGRRFFRQQLDQVISHRHSTQDDPHTSRDTWNLQELADAYLCLDDEKVAAEPTPQETRQFSAIRAGRALVRRSGEWFYCLSGYLTPRDKRSALSRSRWNMDRQNYLSIWREGSGLIVGGGNSKHQPELATFEVRTGPVSLCQADSAELRQEGELDILRLIYGDTATETRLRPFKNGLELTFAVLEKGPNTLEVLGGFTLPCMVGKTVQVSDGAGPVTLTADQVWGHGWHEQPGWLKWKGVRLEASNGFVRWPFYPFNPYAVNNAAPPKEAVALVGFTFEPSAPEHKFLLRPE